MNLLIRHQAQQPTVQQRLPPPRNPATITPQDVAEYGSRQERMTTDQVQHGSFRDTEWRLGQRGWRKPDADTRGLAIARVGCGASVECAVNRERSGWDGLFHPRVHSAPAAKLRVLANSGPGRYVDLEGRPPTRVAHQFHQRSPGSHASDAGCGDHEYGQSLAGRPL